jgi:hypothetical protein
MTTSTRWSRISNAGKRPSLGVSNPAAWVEHANRSSAVTIRHCLKGEIRSFLFMLVSYFNEHCSITVSVKPAMMTGGQFYYEQCSFKI